MFMGVEEANAVVRILLLTCLEIHALHAVTFSCNAKFIVHVWYGILQKQQAAKCSAAEGVEFALDAMRAVSAETTAVPLTLLFRSAHA